MKGQQGARIVNGRCHAAGSKTNPAFTHGLDCTITEANLVCVTPFLQNAERKLERETQTVKIAQRSAQTTREAATQMERPGVILDTTEDRWGETHTWLLGGDPTHAA